MIIFSNLDIVDMGSCKGLTSCNMNFYLYAENVTLLLFT